MNESDSLTRGQFYNLHVPCAKCGASTSASCLKVVPGTEEYVCPQCFSGKTKQKTPLSGKKLLVALAIAGDADAQFRLGKSFETGRPVEAIKWYSMAAKQGHIEARGCAARLEFERAKLYDVGKPHKKVSIAIKWYRQAAEHGHTGAQTRLNEILSEKQRRKAQEAARLARIAKLEEEYEKLLVELDAAQSEITYDYFSNDVDGHLISDRLWESENRDRLIAIEKELEQLRNKK